MGIRAPRISHVKQILNRVLSNPGGANVPKGHIADYVGETSTKRYVIPLCYLNHPSFQHLLQQAEEEFGFHHPIYGCSYNSVQRRILHQSYREYRLPISKETAA